MTTVIGESTSTTTTEVTIAASMTLTGSGTSTTTTVASGVASMTLTGVASSTTTTGVTPGTSMTLTGAASSTTTTTTAATGTVTPYDEEADDMARGAVAYSELVGNSSLADPAGTALNASTDHYIAAAKPEQTVLRVTNTHSSAHDITIVAGDNPPAFAAGLGSLSVEVPAQADSVPGVRWIGPFESGRFLQSDGQLHIDVATGHTGTVTAFLVPRGI